MDVKEAVTIAKSYVDELFGPEGAQNIGLEEVEEYPEEWHVTIGFSRPWDRSNLLMAMNSPTRRSYKLVRIRTEDKQVISVKNRETKG